MTMRQNLFAPVLVLFWLTKSTQADIPFWRSLSNHDYDTNQDEGLNELYGRSGSYYNGTAQIEINITRATDSYKNCSNAISKQFIRELSGIFAVTPPISNESDANYLNMITGFWSPGFNYTELQNSEWRWDDESNYDVGLSARWTLASFEQDNRYNLEFAKRKFPISVSRTSQGTYEAKGNFSGVPDYVLRPIRGLELPTCNCTGWNDTVSVEIGDFIPRLGAFAFSKPDFGFDFDEQGLNMTLEGKNAGTISIYEQRSYTPVYQGDIRITFRGVIDLWHSDFLLTNSSKPEWKQTVGYDEGYFAYDALKSISSRLKSSYVIILVIMMIFLIIECS